MVFKLVEKVIVMIDYKYSQFGTVILGEIRDFLTSAEKEILGNLLSRGEVPSLSGGGTPSEEEIFVFLKGTPLQWSRNKKLTGERKIAVCFYAAVYLMSAVNLIDAVPLQQEGLYREVLAVWGQAAFGIYTSGLPEKVMSDVYDLFLI